MCERCSPALAFDEDQNAVLFVRLEVDGIRDHMLARLGLTGVVRPVAPVPRDDWKLEACPHHGLAIGTGSEDRMHVVRFTGSERRQGQFSAHSTDGGRTFSARIAVGDGRRSAGHADIVASSTSRPPDPLSSCADVVQLATSARGEHQKDPSRQEIVRGVQPEPRFAHAQVERAAWRAALNDRHQECREVRVLTLAGCLYLFSSSRRSSLEQLFAHVCLIGTESPSAIERFGGSRTRAARAGGHVGQGGLGSFGPVACRRAKISSRRRPALTTAKRLCDTADMSEILTIRVPAEEKARWEKAAAAARESVAEYVRGAVRQRAQAASQSPWEPLLGSANVAVPAPTNANIRRAFARRRRHKG